MNGNSWLNPEPRYPMRHGRRGKNLHNYAGILFWNAHCNSKTWASSHKLHGKASVKRKKFVSPVQHHKAGCDRTSFVCAWQGKIGWVAAERTRAATSHFVIFRSLKLYLVGSLTCLRGGCRTPRFPPPPSHPLWDDFLLVNNKQI